MKPISFQADDEIVEFLAEQENRSEAIREAVRLYQWKQEGVDDDRLSDKQVVAYEWLLEYTEGGGIVALDVVRPILAQKLSIGKETVQREIVHKLRRHGYLRIMQGIYDVKVLVLAPSAVEGNDEGEESSGESSPEQAESEESPGLSVDDPEKAGDRLDELAEATPSRGD